MMGWVPLVLSPLQADGRVLRGFRGGQITGDGLMCQRDRVFRFLSINTT